jgi:NAD-reducing hydrogenase large subunit
MPRTIVIDPVTRLEGHGKITLQLDEAGVVQDATFHVTQLRGFEKFCEGRPFYEMPNITARICGICPVSHLVASSKACDAILAEEDPAGGGASAAGHESRAADPVARAEFLLFVVAGSAAGHGCAG